MKTNEILLNEIILKIKKINQERKNNGSDVIAEDESNEEIVEILRSFDIGEDNPDILEEMFGIDGLHKIRDAEAGLY